MVASLVMVFDRVSPSAYLVAIPKRQPSTSKREPWSLQTLMAAGDPDDISAMAHENQTDD